MVVKKVSGISSWTETMMGVSWDVASKEMARKDLICWMANHQVSFSITLMASVILFNLVIHLTDKLLQSGY